MSFCLIDSHDHASMEVPFMKMSRVKVSTVNVVLYQHFYTNRSYIIPSHTLVSCVAKSSPLKFEMLRDFAISRGPFAWRRHQMEKFSALLAICAENSSVLVNFPHKGQWRGALMFSLIYTWMNGWVNNREAGDLRRHRPHCDVTVIVSSGQQITVTRDHRNPEKLLKMP